MLHPRGNSAGNNPDVIPSAKATKGSALETARRLSHQPRAAEDRIAALMRSVIGIAGFMLAIVSPTIASAATIEEVAHCRAIPQLAERLNCFKSLKPGPRAKTRRRRTSEEARRRTVQNERRCTGKAKQAAPAKTEQAAPAKTEQAAPAKTEQAAPAKTEQAVPAKRSKRHQRRRSKPHRRRRSKRHRRRRSKRHRRRRSKPHQRRRSKPHQRIQTRQHRRKRRRQLNRMQVRLYFPRRRMILRPPPRSIVSALLVNRCVWMPRPSPRCSLPVCLLQTQRRQPRTAARPFRKTPNWSF